MNVLVTGGNGQLGKSIGKYLNNPKDNYIFTDIDSLDITDKEAIDRFVNDNNIDIIVNCAAYTNVDKAEDEYETALDINTKAVKILSESIKARNGVLIHISTDYVFGGDGINTPIKEDEATNPTSVYGITKLEGEKEILKSGVKYIILRTSWLYSEFGKNFLKTINDLISTKKEIKVVFDQCGSPTYAGDLARAIIDIIENRKFENNEGFYHYSNEGVCSWYDFAYHILKQNNNSECKIYPCHSSEYPSKVKRPPYSVLDKTKYKKTFEKEVPNWNESLNVCISNLKNV